MSNQKLLIAIVAIATAIHGYSASKTGQVITGNLTRVGTTQMATLPGSADQVVGHGFLDSREADLLEGKARLAGRRTQASLQAPRPANLAVASGERISRGFPGMSHLDQRLADNASQFESEPPDPALAVGGGFVMQAVNLALSIYDQAGNLLSGPTALNPFFGLPSAVEYDPVTGGPLLFGPSLTDPKCYYDPDTARWFVTILGIDVDPSTGAWLGTTSLFIAVSQTSDPTGSYYLYQLDTTPSGLPDQPLIGADAHGFFLSYSSFLFPDLTFNGGEILAISKSALVNGTADTAVFFNGLTQAEGPGYSIQPATVPPGGSHESARDGTEYFLSALDFDASLDNRITVWAITRTRSLDSPTPALLIQNVVINSQVYGQPPKATQRDGVRPLAEWIALGFFGPPVQEPVGLIDSNDDRMNQAIFSSGKLFGSVNTVVQSPNGPDRVGIAYFVVAPKWTGRNLSAQLTQGGYVAANRNHVLFPGIGVNAAGKGLMTFTLVGPDYFPSVAFVMIDATLGVTGPILLAGSGVGLRPYDGFGCYPEFLGSNVGRWGDYHTAVADADGSIWFTTEYVRKRPRTVFENWDTFIGTVTP